MPCARLTSSCLANEVARYRPAGRSNDEGPNRCRGGPDHPPPPPGRPHMEGRQREAPSRGRAPSEILLYPRIAMIQRTRYLGGDDIIRHASPRKSWVSHLWQAFIEYVIESCIPWWTGRRAAEGSSGRQNSRRRGILPREVQSRVETLCLQLVPVCSACPDQSDRALESIDSGGSAIFVCRVVLLCSVCQYGTSPTGQKRAKE